MNSPAWLDFLEAADRYHVALKSSATEETRERLKAERDTLYPAARREVQAACQGEPRTLLGRAR